MDYDKVCTIVSIKRSEYDSLIAAKTALDLLAANWYKPNEVKLALLDNILDAVRKDTEGDNA